MAQVTFVASLVLLASAWFVSKLKVPGKGIIAGCGVVAGGLLLALTMLIALATGQM